MLWLAISRNISVSYNLQAWSWNFTSKKIIMANKSDKKPSRGRYASENHVLLNKISKMTRFVREHPQDIQAEARLEELLKLKK